jgi:hypothetical protein
MILFTLSDPWGLEGPARKAGFTHVISKAEPWKLLDSIKEIVEEIERAHDSVSDEAPKQVRASRHDPSVH